MINKARANSQVTDFSPHVLRVEKRLRQEDDSSRQSGVVERARRRNLLIHLYLEGKHIRLSFRFRTVLELNFLQHEEAS
jgi:hypothetical protein